MVKAANRRRGWPIQVALTIAPTGGALPTVALMFAFYRYAGPGEPPVGLFVSMWLAWAMLGIMAAWTLGLAWHANAMRKNWRRARDYAVGGAVLGLVLGSVGLIAILIGFTQANGDPVPLAYIIVATTLCLALGVCLMAATMWLVWLLRRPDRDHAPNIVGELD